MAAPRESSDPVEDLIGRAVQELEQRGEQGLQEFLACHATHAHEVHAGLERLRRLGILAPPPAVPADRVQFGEFTVTRRIGAGGMGVVYAAVQKSLQRTVALKVVRPEFLLSSTARARFQREVEAIARLQHPGIVPILAVGDDEAQPWFAMEFVDGHTLEEAIAAMRGKDPAHADGNALRATAARTGAGSGASAVFAGSYWEASVRLVHQVATTMAYVHEQGIVHRDLKPSNVVVTKQGQAMVLDFGLAHVRDLQRVTLEARPLGTPAYVAPEQLRGEAIDERVDVYGLGVTLYELLTTTLPFERDQWPALEKAILAGDAPSVRLRNRAVPRELAVVCAVAMATDRARRYPSMAAFAADLEAVLARRPIRARPPGFGLRLVRFAQRHPTWSIALGALLVLALQFPLVLWQWTADANQRLEQSNTALASANTELARSNAEKDRQRAAAVASFDDALDAVQQVLVSSAQSDLATTPAAEQAQLAMLRRADAQYERLRRKQPGHRRLEFVSARNLQHIGTQLGKLGDAPGAEAAYRAALARLEPWSSTDFAYLRGGIARSLGLALGRRGERVEALAMLEHSVCELEAAMRGHAGDRVVMRQMADAYASLGTAKLRGDRSVGHELLQRAQELRQALFDGAPDDVPGALAYAAGCSQLASMAANGDPATAEAWASRGIAALAPLAPTTEEEATLRGRIGSLHDARGVQREVMGDHAAAAVDHGIALAVRLGLAHDYPKIVAHRFDVAASWNNLAMVERHLEGPAAAAASYREALVHFRQAVRLAPTNVDYVWGTVNALANLGVLMLELGDPREVPDLLDELATLSREPNALLMTARLALMLSDTLGGKTDAATWTDFALDKIEAAIDAGFRSRAHFTSSRLGDQYDSVRTHPRFEALLARLPGETR